MEKAFALAALSVALCAGSALAASSSYVTLSKNGVNNTTNAFISQSGKQIRVVGAIALGDTNNCELTFRTGTAAFVLTQTNAPNGVSLTVNTTNGLSGGDFVLLQKQTGAYALSRVLGYTSPTNIVLTNAFSLDGRIGDEVYLLSAGAAVPVGNATVNYQGGAIYVGDFNRPVVVTCGPGLTTNRQASVTAIYD